MKFMGRQTYGSQQLHIEQTHPDSQFDFVGWGWDRDRETGEQKRRVLARPAYVHIHVEYEIALANDDNGQFHCMRLVFQPDAVMVI